MSIFSRNDALSGATEVTIINSRNEIKAQSRDSIFLFIYEHTSHYFHGHFQISTLVVFILFYFTQLLIKNRP